MFQSKQKKSILRNIEISSLSKKYILSQMKVPRVKTPKQTTSELSQRAHDILENVSE